MGNDREVEIAAAAGRLPIRCYACQLPVSKSDDLVGLEEEDGTRWVVHRACLNDKFEQVKSDA